MKSTFFHLPLNLLPALLTLFALPASALPGNVSVTLTPAEEQDPARYPYRRAELTINNDTDRRIDACQLRWRQGGPTIQFPRIHIPPNSEWKIALELPAISLIQTYDLELLPAGRSDCPAFSAAAEINWPVKLLTTGEFIDPAAYEPYEGDLPQWPNDLRRKAFLLLLVSSVLLCGLLFIRRGMVRLVLLLVIAGAASVAIGMVLSPSSVVVEEIDDLLVLRSRRKARVIITPREVIAPGDQRFPIENYYPVPVYMAPWQMGEDNSIIYTGGSNVHLTLRPDEVRLFRGLGKRKENRVAR